MKEHKWHLLVYPNDRVTACYTCDPVSFLHCETCDNIGDLNQSEIERRLSRLTLAEAALTAAGEYIATLEAETDGSDFIPYGKPAYTAAREAWDGVTK